MIVRLIKRNLVQFTKRCLIFKTRNVGPFSGTRLGHVYSKKITVGSGTNGRKRPWPTPPSSSACAAGCLLPCLLLRCTGAVLVLQPHRRLHPVPGRGRCSPRLGGGGCGCTARSLLREDWSQRTEQRNSQRGEKRRRMGTEAGVARR